jgi:alpha-glucosidase
MFNPHWTAGVHHDGSPRYVVADRFVPGAPVTLRLRTGLEAAIERIFVCTSPDGEQHMEPMRRAGTDAACQWWEGDLRLSGLRNMYRFYLLTAEGGWWLTAVGMLRYTPTDANDFNILAHYRAPGWVHDAVFYQIFPDRFADGDPSNNVRSGEYLCYGRPVVARPWGERPRPHSESGGVEFFGGDLQGIVQRLDYIQELGASALYLTPIFTAPSNHKYDVEDYKQVDRHFGGDAALLEPRRALDERGMKLVLDMVPNHCGATNPWFLAAQADPTAPTAEFFTFRQRPDDYVSWLGVRSLPKLNYRSERLREWMYAGEDAIMRYWLRPPFRIDGWRLDVANMLARQGESQLEHKIGRGIRRAVKSESPQAYLLGENVFDGTPQLQGDELDAVMNYRGFSLPLLSWLSGFDIYGTWRPELVDPQPLPTEALAAQWQAFLSAIPWQIATQQFNLLGSHDTPRIATVLGNDEALMRVAVTLLCTYPGVPSVYYGDEIGLNGGGDPNNRRCMPWDPREWNADRRVFYQALMKLRRTSPALRRGGYQLLYASGDTLAFQRESNEERLIIVVRRSDDGLAALPVLHGGLPDGIHLRELLTGNEAVVANGMLPLDSLPPVGAQIWQYKSAVERV